MLEINRYSTSGPPLEAALSVMLQKWADSKQMPRSELGDAPRWIPTLEFAKYLVEHFEEFKQTRAVLEKSQK